MSKRRRVEPPSKQSKLHHFFSKPVDRTMKLLSQNSYQSQKSKSTDAVDDKLKVVKDQSQVNSLTRLHPKDGSFDRGDPGTIAVSCVKVQGSKKGPILRDLMNSASHVDDKSIHGKNHAARYSSFSEEKFQHSSNEPLDIAPVPDQLRRQPNTPANCAESQPDEINTNDVMTLGYSPVIGKPNCINELAEKSLDSNDVDTFPYSVQIGNPPPVLKPSPVITSPGVLLEGKSAVQFPGLNQETLEELHTNDVETLPFSFVIGKPLQKTTPTSYKKALPPKSGSSTESECEFSELNSADVLTLPCSFVVGNEKKNPVDTTTSLNESREQGTEKDPSNVEISKNVQTAPKTSQKVQLVSGLSQKVKETDRAPVESLSYMDRVWAMFHSDSEEEQNEDATTSTSAEEDPNSSCENRPTNCFYNSKPSASKECHVSQLEELNTEDVMTVPYSPIVGEVEAKPTLHSPKRRSNSDSILGEEEDSLVEEDSLTLDSFRGMKGPDSIFMEG